MPLLDPFDYRAPFRERRIHERNHRETRPEQLLASKILKHEKELLRREIMKAPLDKPMKANILPQKERTARHLCMWMAAFDDTVISETQPYGTPPSPGAKNAGYSQLHVIWIRRRYERDYVKNPLPVVQVMIAKKNGLEI